MIHKFKQGGQNILLDVNSGAVHLIDDMTFEIMDIFNGTNDSEVLTALENKYSRAELIETLGELHELIDAEELFAPDLEVPPTFKSIGIVKSLCLMVAQDCNLRCKYCFGAGGSYGHKGVKGGCRFHY